MAFLAPLAVAVPAFLGSSAGIAALTGATALISAGTAISQGNYQAAVAKNNARIAEQNAARTSEAAQLEAQRSDQDYRAAVAEMLAAQGASGFDILGRSQTQARALTTRTGRRAARDIRLEGEAGARQSLQDAANFRAEGKQARTQGYLTAAGTVIGAGADIMKSGTLIGRRRRARPWDRRG